MAKRKGKSKNPAIGPGVHPKETKTANHHFESDPDRDNKNPISWVLGNIDWDGPFGWQAFKPGNHLEELLKQLKLKLVKLSKWLKKRQAKKNLK